ncbi:MAG: peptidyl-prolyl cis-trans isomerase [Bacteroidia bacterium]|nr:peptidyl-prolyl cis-trans isomerase [Bacteroidia bacterium]
MLLNEYYEGILLFDIMEKEVWNKASADSIGQHEFYLQHAQDYNAGERVRAELYITQTAAARTELRAAIVAGKDTAVDTVISAYNIRFEKGLYEQKDRPVFSLISWSPGVHEAEKDGIYYLAKISEILPPGPKTFEEARATVIADYQNELERIWLGKLRKKYPVKVNEKGKAYIFKSLKI